MVNRSSSSGITHEAEEESISDLDLPRLLLVGSGFYTALNCATYPLAVVKTRMQASRTQMSSMEAARELLRASGVRGFYAGLVPVLLGALPARAGYITALEGTRPRVLEATKMVGLSGPAAAAVSNGAAGFAAVLASQTIYTPCEVVTQRIMVASGATGVAAEDQSFLAVVRSIMVTGGWRGFYRGFGVTLVAYLPGGSVWWGAYGGARAVVADHTAIRQRVPTVIEQAVAATWASLCTVLVTSPLDVLKTRVQLSTAATAPSLVETGRQLLAQEGIAGLYRGVFPRWVQASIFTGALRRASPRLASISSLSHPLPMLSGCVINIYEHLKRVCRKERD